MPGSKGVGNHVNAPTATSWQLDENALQEYIVSSYCVYTEQDSLPRQKSLKQTQQLQVQLDISTTARICATFLEHHPW